MSSITKNISRCRRCVSLTSKRRLNSGSSNVVDSAKMQAKNIVLNQWKLINELKTYFAKLTNDKTFENALNEEFAQFLQKIDAKTYGSGLIRYFTSQIATTPKRLAEEVSLEPSRVSLPKFVSALNIKIGTKVEEKKEVIPKWKLVKPLVSSESISSRTRHILSALTSADSMAGKLLQVEDLVLHIKKYPEAKHTAVKQGAISKLLYIRERTVDPNLQGALSEAFALLGFADPVPGRGIRILSIDGGGVRGLLVIEMLRKLEELTGKPMYEMFDFICGVSTGAIIATLLGLKNLTLDEITEIYRTISTKIFSQSPLKGSRNLVWTHAYYDTTLWEKILKAQWDERLMIETRRNLKVPKSCAVSAIVNQSRLAAYVFRNYSLPCKVHSQYMGGYNHKVWESVRASAAAPTYFSEFKIGNMLHQDGGILVNNPTAVAIHEAKLLWPTTPIQCVVSFGTGRTVPNPIDSCVAPINTQIISTSSWKKKFLALLGSATDTEGVHSMLSDLLPANTYFRFNPYLSETFQMAEIHPNKLEQLKRDALMYLRRNEDKFQDAAKALCKEKQLPQKIIDWLNLKKEIHGFNQI